MTGTVLYNTILLDGSRLCGAVQNCVGQEYYGMIYCMIYCKHPNWLFETVIISRGTNHASRNLYDSLQYYDKMNEPIQYSTALYTALKNFNKNKTCQYSIICLWP